MRRSYWIAVGLAFAVGVPAIGQPPAPATPPGSPAPWANKFFLADIGTNREQTPPPVLVHNFGDVPHGTLCVHTFTITNIYDVPMQITDVRKSCSCLDFVPMTRVLQPNETAEFTVTMNSAKFVGFNAQTFYVTFGPKFISTAVIRVQATSRTDVSVNPGAVVFGTVSQGAKSTQAVRLEYKGKSRDWRVTEVVPPGGPIDVQVKELSRGGVLKGGVEYTVEVTLKPTAPAGPISETVTLKTNDPTNPLVQITVTGTVAAPLVVDPGRVQLDGVPVGQSRVMRVAVRSARPFRVVGVDGTGDGITAELPAAPAALPYQVVTIKFEATQPGVVSKQLVIRTDLDGGARVVLPVEAEGVK